MLPSISQRSSSYYVSHAVVRLEALSQDNKTLGWASGFVVNEKDYLSLYTCWHVVTGADPHNLPTTPPPRRERLRVHTLATSSRTPEVTVIGGLKTFDIDLYNNVAKPIWTQGEPQTDTESARLPPPHWDCVRLDVSNFQEYFPGAFQPEDDILNRLDISEEAYIVGYPYAYSANETGPDPIFLRRTPCSMWGPRFFNLLDGPGAKGMSGGPVVTRINNEWRLAGIYNGAVFPEATYFSDELNENNGSSRLPLGKYTLSKVARMIVGVSAENMGLTSTVGS